MNRIIDCKRLAGLGGVGNPELRRILNRFVSALPGYLIMLEAAIAAGDSKESLGILHRLKGSALTCGFTAIAQAVTAAMDSSGVQGSCLKVDLEAIVQSSIHEWNLMVEFSEPRSFLRLSQAGHGRLDP